MKEEKYVMIYCNNNNNSDDDTLMTITIVNNNSTNNNNNSNFQEGPRKKSLEFGVKPANHGRKELSKLGNPPMRFVNNPTASSHNSWFLHNLHPE